MEVVYDFESTLGRIYEIKRTDLPSTVPKHERFQWYWNNQPLTILQVEGSKRFFTNGWILHLQELTLTCPGETHTLEISS